MCRRHSGWAVRILALCLLLLVGQNCRDEDTEQVEKESQEAVRGDYRRVNALTAEEQAEGWALLFDGASLEHWRGFKQNGIPLGWEIRDGAIHFAGGIDAGDIITVEQYQDFDLRLEWRVSEGGNSGIFFHVSEDFDHTWESGPEMQVLDNTAHRDGGKPETRAGTNYALHPASKEVARPAGEWNQVRLVVDGAQVQHWLNGEKIVEYKLWSEDWKARVAKSKFTEMPGYGQSKKGHIALQDHNDPVWYRGIKIRSLRTE